MYSSTIVDASGESILYVLSDISIEEPYLLIQVELYNLHLIHKKEVFHSQKFFNSSRRFKSCSKIAERKGGKKIINDSTITRNRVIKSRPVSNINT